MSFPKLVRGAKTPVRVIINSEAVNEFGERTIILDKFFLCNYQESSATKYSANKQHTEVTGTVFIDGDILESLGIENLNFGITKTGVLTMVGAQVDERGVLSYSDEEEGESNLIVSGQIVIFGTRRNIIRGTKARNLDGSVNYTRLDVV